MAAWWRYKDEDMFAKGERVKFKDREKKTWQMETREKDTDKANKGTAKWLMEEKDKSCRKKHWQEKITVT